MSKSTIKKLLKSMKKEDIIEMVLELYSARKEAKEYLEFYAEPDEEGMLEKYKTIIQEEFFPENERKNPQLRFSVCKKAISDFKKLKPSADAIAELMVSYMECATEFIFIFGGISEQFCGSVLGNFDKTIQYVVEYGLWHKYDARLQQCVIWSENVGYGFSDTIEEIYEEEKWRCR